jgi:hypothetical protein
MHTKSQVGSERKCILGGKLTSIGDNYTFVLQYTYTKAVRSGFDIRDSIISGIDYTVLF